MVSMAALSFVMMRQLDEEAVALGFQDSADHQKAESEGIAIRRFGVFAMAVAGP